MLKSLLSLVNKRKIIIMHGNKIIEIPSFLIKEILILILKNKNKNSIKTSLSYINA